MAMEMKAAVFGGLCVGAQRLAADLTEVVNAAGVVVFAHGSGSSRLSRRNRQVAQALQMRGLSTLLFDLLTETEARDRGRVFDVDLLTHRLLEAVETVRQREPALPVGLFGASTGAAAALMAAARRPDDVQAVVSRGGRPDLAGDVLARVRSPTLLIVGAADPEVLALNRRAYDCLGCARKQFEIVPRATHLFEEAGALEEVARLAGDWFMGCFDRLRDAAA